MIQRIQTLYLLFATVLIVVCMSSCIGYYVSDDDGRVGQLFNLLCKGYEDGHPAKIDTTFSLFVILLITSTLIFLNIFLFKYRALQMRVCVFCMILLVGWYAAYTFFAWYLSEAFQSAVSFKVTVWASLPFVSLILLYLAFRGILKDEKLVRSLDRLR